MVNLAGHILKTKATHFDPKKFKDEYEDALKKLVRRKASGKVIEAPEREEKSDNVVSLMDALKESLKTKGAGRRSAAKSRARRSPHRRPAKRAHRSAARHRRGGGAGDLFGPPFRTG